MYKKWNDYSESERSSLIKSAQEGSEKAITTIWLSMYGAVKMNAIRHRHNSGSLEVEDLIQESFFFFIEAVKKYDEERGVSLLTYVMNNIKKRLHREINRKGSVVRLPEYIVNGHYKIKKALREIGETEVTESNIEYISLLTKIKKSKIKDIIGAVVENGVVFSQDNVFEGEREWNENDEMVIDAIEKLQKTLTTAEFTMIRHLLGLQTEQLTKGIILKKFDISRRSFDNVISKARRILEE